MVSPQSHNKVFICCMVAGTESINGFSEMQSEIPKILSMEVNHQQMKNVKDQNFFGLNPAPVEQLYEETNTSQL